MYFNWLKCVENSFVPSIAVNIFDWRKWQNLHTRTCIHVLYVFSFRFITSWVNRLQIRSCDTRLNLLCSYYLFESPADLKIIIIPGFYRTPKFQMGDILPVDMCPNVPCKFHVRNSILVNRSRPNTGIMVHFRYQYHRVKCRCVPK